MWVVVHAVAPPVGAVETSALPAASTATQSAVDGHETPRTSTAPALSVLFCVMLVSTWAAVQAAAPPVGSCEVITLPAASTATHRTVDGHETLVSSLLPSTSARLHASGPPAGSVDQRTPPPRSTATHSAVDGHARLSSGWASTSPGAVHSSGPGLLVTAALVAGAATRPSANSAAAISKPSVKRARSGACGMEWRDVAGTVARDDPARAGGGRDPGYPVEAGVSPVRLRADGGPTRAATSCTDGRSVSLDLPG